MRFQEISELSEEELVEKLKSAKEELFNLRFQHATGQLDNPMKIKAMRKEIARILTVKKQKELAIETLERK